MNDRMPGHLSYSSLSTWLGCGKQYELTRIKKMPETGSVWLVGGSAFHTLTEEYDRWLMQETRSMDGENPFQQARSAGKAPSGD